MNKLLHILIVEDSEDDTLLLLRRLKGAGYEPVYERVDTASGLLASLKKPGWDIAVSDYIMPELSGIEALNLIQKHRPDLPCIIISGKITDETAVAAMKAGARDYIAKDNLSRLSPAIEREMAEAENRQKHLQAQEQIRQNTELIEKLFDSMAEGAILWSGDLKVVKANVEAGRIFGISEKEMEGQPVDINKWSTGRAGVLIRRDGTALPSEEMAPLRALKEKKEIKHTEIGIKWSDKTITWLVSSTAPILNQKGDVAGCITTLADVTEEKQLRDERDQFTKRLINVQEEERKRVARELHDDTAQNLALLMLEMDSILLNQQNLPPKSLERLKQLKEDIERTLNDVRRYSHELRPGVLDHLGIEAALEGLADDLKERGQIETELKIDGEADHLPEEVELAMFRIAQEAANNIKRHSTASKAVISLKYTLEKVRLLVTDNGQGFSVNQKKHSGSSGCLGLVGMKERAELIGAKLRIRSTPGQGTVVSLEVPRQPV